jgi:D-lactate dehydrogenase
VDLKTIVKKSDVISLHVPLNSDTKHVLDAPSFELMKKNVVIVNTGRGSLINTQALINALKNHAIAGACLDVYEEEAGVFFSDLSEAGIDDDLLARLLTFPNVLITSHQAFLTHEALKNIADTTMESCTLFETGGDLARVRVIC